MRRPVLATILATALVVPSILAPAVASADLDGIDDEELAAIQEINEIRAQLGLPELLLSPILTEAAEWMANDLADRDTIDHTDSLGRAMPERIHSFGYPDNAFIRENLVVGTDLDRGAEAVDEWQGSPGHRANNEASDVDVAGIARVHAPNTQWQWFWVLNLGSANDSGTMSVEEFQEGGSEPTPTPSGNEPVGTEPGTFSTEFPASGIGLNSWNGGSIEELAAGAQAGGASAIFITVEGRWMAYSLGAPDFVNERFVSQFSGGNVPAGTVMLIVVG